MKKLVLLPFVAATVAVSAPIKSVTFDGLLYLSTETAKEITNLKPGRELNIEEVNKAIRVLFEQQYFEDIWVDDDDGHLVVYVKEKPTVAKVNYTGIGDTDKTAIESFTEMKKGKIYDLNHMENSKMQIIKYFESKGFFDTVVEIETENLNERSIVITYVINRGENIIIKNVDLVGSKNVKYKHVEPTIANKEREFMGWLWGRNDGKLNLFELETDSARIKDVYFKRGYLDAEVSTPYLRAYFDNYEASLEYKVSEGARYKIKSIQIDIPGGYLDIEKMKKKMILQEGDVFNVNKVRKDTKLIEDTLADQGYAFVGVYPDVKKDSQEHLTDLIYTVVPGDKVYVRDVRVAGNSVTLDRVIRRDIYLAPKDLYSRSELTESKDALKRTGYFEDVIFNEERVSKDQIDLIAEVKETQTGTIGGGIGYGSSDGFLINGYVSENNIFGSGMRASLDIERSNKELSGSLSLNNPRVFDSKYSLGGSVYRKEFKYQDYNELTTGGNIVVGRSFGRYFSASVKYALESSELSHMPSSSKYNYDSNFRLKSLKSAITPSIMFNNTDDYFMPRRGITAVTSLEYAGVGGDQKFLKSTTRFAAFYGFEDLINYDLILRYKAQFGWVRDEGYLPINERLYIGGTSSLRGFESNSVAPKNANDVLLGGTMSFTNAVEASIPLVERLKMRASLFLDYGMIGDKNLEHKKASTGIVIEWTSPMGPVQLIFSKPIKKSKGDQTSGFEFTMGRSF